MMKYINRLSESGKTAINFLFIQGFMWFAWAFTCYGVVYLQDNGFPASSIGSLNALCSAVAIFAMMFWGMLSDKINSVKKVLIFTTVISAVVYSLIPLLPTTASFSVLIFFIYFPMLNIFRCSIPPLLDNLTVRTCTQKGVNYGIVRSFGSFTFTIGSLIVVWVISNIGLDISFYISALLYLPCFFLLFFAHDPKNIVEKEKGKKVSVSPLPLFKDYYYVSFLVFAAIVYVAFTSEISFITYFMEDVGVENSNYGNFLAVRALAEIPLLIVIVKLRQKIKSKYLIIFGGALMGIQCFLLSFFGKDVTSILLCGIVFGLGNGLFIGSVPFYLFKLAPPQLKATAQTVFSSICSISGIIGNLLGGFVFELVGSKMFYIGVGTLIIIGVIFFSISTSLRKNLPNPADIV